MIRKCILLGIDSSVYPPLSGETMMVEKLSMYRDNCLLNSKSEPIDSQLDFDIERYVSWDDDYKLKPFKYALMVHTYHYPESGKNLIDIKYFLERASKMKDFANFSGGYYNKTNNLFINVDNENIRDGNGCLIKNPRRIAVGIIQRDPIADLSYLIQTIAPNAEHAQNELNPNNPLGKVVFKMVTERAKTANEKIPMLVR